MGKKRQIKKTVVYPVAFMLLVAVSIVYKCILNRQSSGMVIKSSGTVASEETVLIDETTVTEDRTCQVYICGAVNSPGVFTMPCGSILNDAVLLAGGLTEDAPAERINLVYELDANISVYIPTRDELQNGYSGDPLIIRTNDSGYIWGTPTTEQTYEEVSGLININTASREELMTLPGIGESTADAIIAYREETPFTSTQDIMNVSGIGESKYNRIKDLICV
ncbi:competence protein ComEA [Oscillospiraceae bacterium]|nr:competence protein ComEA [Oscillospiraceae bacterium]